MLYLVPSYVKDAVRHACACVQLTGSAAGQVGELWSLAEPSGSFTLRVVIVGLTASFHPWHHFLFCESVHHGCYFGRCDSSTLYTSSY